MPHLRNALHKRTETISKQTNKLCQGQGFYPLRLLIIFKCLSVILTMSETVNVYINTSYQLLMPRFSSLETLL